MTPHLDLLTQLMRTEHAAIARALAEARSDAQLRDAADRALGFAAGLLTGQDRAGQSPGQNTQLFLGVPFWHYASRATFLRDWPSFAADTLGLAEQAIGRTAPEEAQLAALATPLRPRNLILLYVRSDKWSNSSPVLVMDGTGVTNEQLIRFLFALVLQRVVGKDDLAALKAVLPPLDTVGDRPAAIANLCNIIINSAEAQARDVCWTYH